jgi:predicted dehydrogenase
MRDPAGLPQLWPMPSAPRPITVIGAGGIVSGAHLPAYRKWGLPVAGIHDIDAARARAVAAAFGVPRVHATLAEALAQDTVFDIALPPQALAGVLAQLPRGAVALIQKPPGRDLAEARRLAALLAGRDITAAVNFQMRLTPAMLALDAALAAGLLGEILEIEVHLVTRTPWEDWPFLTELPAVEIPLHSIHYLDWIRAAAGMPRAAYARALPHPDHPRLADARSAIILDYGDRLRCCLSLNHTHRWGPRHETATLRVEGRRGAAIVGLGYTIHLPAGAPETLAMVSEGGDWQAVPLQGARVPDSFAFVMANLQRFAAGEDARLVTAMAEGVETMRLVAACLGSNAAGTAVTLEEGGEP